MLKPARPPIVAVMMLMPWLASCVGERPPPVAALTATAAEPTARRAEISRRLARVCPATMTPAELTAAADILERHPDALALVRRLDLFDRQSAVCRGAAP